MSNQTPAFPLRGKPINMRQMVENDGFVKEGFWFSRDEPDLPKPQAQKEPFADKEEILRLLRDVENVAYVARFRGLSQCRCCGNMNGCAEYSWNRGSARFRWPSGFMHYIEVHNVRPSEQFVKFLRSVARKSL